MIKSLENEFNSINNKCYKCGNEGHFVNDCDIDNNKYLEKFNDEKDIITEIKNIKDLLYNIENYETIINNFKYIKNYKDEQIEISPELKNTICENKNLSKKNNNINHSYDSIKNYDTITILKNNINKNHKYILDFPEIISRIDELYNIMNTKYLNIEKKQIIKITNNNNYLVDTSYLTTLSKVYEIYYFRLCNEKKLNEILPKDIPKSNIMVILNKRIEQLYIKLLNK